MTISEKEPVRDADPSGDLETSAVRASGIDPVRMAIALEVFEELDELPVDHPQAIELRRATARLYKTVKQRNRKEQAGCGCRCGRSGDGGNRNRGAGPDR